MCVLMNLDYVPYFKSEGIEIVETDFFNSPNRYAYYLTYNLNAVRLLLNGLRQDQIIINLLKASRMEISLHDELIIIIFKQKSDAIFDIRTKYRSSDFKTHQKIDANIIIIYFYQNGKLKKISTHKLLIKDYRGKNGSEGWNFKGI